MPTPITRSAPDHRALIAAVRLWEDQQRHRIRIGNMVGAVERAGAAIPQALRDSLERQKESEDAIGKLVVAEWRKHPLAPWCKTVRGLGEHSAAILVAMLDGDPYIAHPKVWVKVGQEKDATQSPDAGMNEAGQLCPDTHGSCARDDDADHERNEAHTTTVRTLIEGEPFARTPSQLWQYAGVGRPGRRKAGMTQEEALALGKPLLKSRLRLIAEGMLKATNETYRAVYDAERAKVAARTHVGPCAQCKAKEGAPWRPGHQHAHALRVVAKRFLLDLWCEAKRLHDGEGQCNGETHRTSALSNSSGHRFCELHTTCAAPQYESATA